MGLEKFDMTNKEAAAILKHFLNSRVNVIGGRGNGKTYMQLRIIQAFCKAIDILEKTPDKNNSHVSRKNHTPL